MRLSKLLIGILLFIGSATYAQHSPQDTLTAYYYRYPQQAIKDAEALYRQAIKNNDTPLLIKSLILKTTFTLAIDHEDYPAILSRKIPFPGDGFCRYSCHKFLLCPALCRVLQ